MPNAQGKLETLKRDTWVWLIGMTDAGDDELRQWAQSFAHPPRLEAQGARPAAEPYAPERRALCLTVENPSVTITITPDGHCVNPVFELAHAPRRCRPSGSTIGRWRPTAIAGTGQRSGSAPAWTGRRP